MKYPFITLLKPSSNNKARKGMKAKSISTSALLQALFAAAAVATVLSVQACMKNTLEEYGSTNGSNDISFICKESNANSKSDCNDSNSNNNKENDKTTKTAPTTSLTQPIGLFAYKHDVPNMNTGAQQFAHNHQITPIGGGTGKAPII